ncbi:DUF4435 domain-containing protein [Paraglaciecola agarilytica]|uniref:DUF4435 domain-containing protein n=1 Tax=Paraglaciecola chathamensis TaxID=368405 RepID=UPI001C0A53B1|nr:DUF4435 domain-containing protein [Paraglaciecola agarilytica]MBU3020167.1 DUF4435 domain-containing protein [Paraglaciecola agarilytica]
MSLVDELRSLKRGESITYLNFLHSLKKDNPAVHIFYEGKTDNGFYGSLIRRELNEQATIKTYVCGNKSEVFKTREKLTCREYDKDSLLFMVDKDIDDLIPKYIEDHHDVHTTSCYSVENYLVTPDIFEQACSEFFKLDVGNAQLLHIKEKFIIAHEGFCNSIKPVMAWALSCRRLKLRPSLNEIKMGDIVQIDENLELHENFNKNNLLNYLHYKCNLEATVFKNYIGEIEQELSLLSFEKYLRGKYHLWFLIEFFDKSKKALEIANGSKIKLHFNLNVATALDVLGPRIRTPDSISDFCKSICHDHFLAA